MPIHCVKTEGMWEMSTGPRRLSQESLPEEGGAEPGGPGLEATLREGGVTPVACWRAGVLSGE